MAPATPYNSRGTSTSSTVVTSEDIDPIEFETILNRTLNNCNKLAKSRDHLCTNQEVVVAKMLNYCIRMLQAEGWHPPTIIRAMVLREIGNERSMKGIMYQALRERRKEIKISRAQRAAIDPDEFDNQEADMKKTPTRGHQRKKTVGVEGGDLNLLD